MTGVHELDFTVTAENVKKHCCITLDGGVLPILLIGILLSAGGTLAWTHDYDRRKKLKSRAGSL